MAKVDIMSLFITVLLMQLFFSMAITLIVYATPADVLEQESVRSFSQITGEVNLTTTAARVQSGLEKQTNIPVIDIGALIFYSGNILLDLILNFSFAIPEMIGLVVYGLSNLIRIDTQIIYIVQAFAGLTILIMYFIALIQLLTGMRSGRVI